MSEVTMDVQSSTRPTCFESIVLYRQVSDISRSSAPSQPTPSPPQPSYTTLPFHRPYNLFATPPNISSKASLAGTSLSAATSSAKHPLRRPYHSSVGMGWTSPSEMEVGEEVAKRSR